MRDLTAELGLSPRLSEEDFSLPSSEASGEPAPTAAVPLPAPHKKHREPHPHGHLPNNQYWHSNQLEHHAPTWEEFGHGWQLGIYRDPVLTGGFAGAILGLLGVFIVLRRAVFVTAAVSQAAGLGVALVFFFGIRYGLELPPVAGALLLAVLSTISLALPSTRLRLSRESLLGFAFLAASAGALLIGDRISQEAHDIAAILFGTAVMVRPADFWLVFGVGTLVLVTLVVSYRGLVFSGFDPDTARVHGLPVRRLELLFWLMVALMVSVSTRALGSLPVFAFGVLPAMTALACFNRLGVAAVAATVLGAVAGGTGYLFAFFFEFPVGASQAFVLSLLFALTLPIAVLRRRR
jgi:zinc transport system permease protein